MSARHRRRGPAGTRTRELLSAGQARYRLRYKPMRPRPENRTRSALVPNQAGQPAPSPRMPGQATTSAARPVLHLPSTVEFSTHNTVGRGRGGTHGRQDSNPHERGWSPSWSPSPHARRCETPPCPEYGGRRLRVWSALTRATCPACSCLRRCAGSRVAPRRACRRRRTARMPALAGSATASRITPR
jgi:hypothetical protein